MLIDGAASALADGWAVAETAEMAIARHGYAFGQAKHLTGLELKFLWFSFICYSKQNRILAYRY